MNPMLRRKFFVATESILLYGCEAWTLTKSMEKSLDGTYTRMLRRVLNVHWSDKMTNVTLYGGLPKLSDKIAARRLMEPTHGQRGRGRPATTYVDQLKRDAGVSDTRELSWMMEDRDVWRTIVDSRLRSNE